MAIDWVKYHEEERSLLNPQKISNMQQGKERAEVMRTMALMKIAEELYLIRCELGEMNKCSG